MKVIIDDKIPYIKGALEPFGEVVYLPGKDTTAEVVKNADAIITRTRTKCNKHLLAGSKVKMIATATIGFDHIDTDYCAQNGVEWTNAPGCNSWSVAQYIMAVLYLMAKEKHLQLDQMTIGVVGAGNVGSKVARFCRIIGMKVLVNDPPRQRAEGDDGFVELTKICKEADIITFHTPLIHEGDEHTFHLVDEKFIGRCKDDVVLINSSRGEVMDTSAVKNALTNEKISTVVIDCWENEPDIDRELLHKAFIATPHIAGYSKDGKANGTSMSIQAISHKFNLGIDNWQCDKVELPDNTLIKIDGTNQSKAAILSEVILKTYSIAEDRKRLKEAPQDFEKQRGDYPVRREFPIYTVESKNVDQSVLSVLSDLGFQLK